MVAKISRRKSLLVPSKSTQSLLRTTLKTTLLSDAMLSLLFSSEESDDVRQIRVTDQGSEPRHAKVEVQGVPARGVIDSAAITIIGGGLFKRVAAVAKLKKRDLKKVDQVPRTYDQRPFQCFIQTFWQGGAK